MENPIVDVCISSFISYEFNEDKLDFNLDAENNWNDLIYEWLGDYSYDDIDLPEMSSEFEDWYQHKKTEFILSGGEI